MTNLLQDKFERAKKSIIEADSPESLEKIRIALLGKKGYINSLMSELRTLPPEKKADFGFKINVFKQEVKELITNQKFTLDRKKLESAMSSGKIDTSLPGRKNKIGSLHIISQTINRIQEIFERIGFEVKEGPEVENDWYNFEALNFSKDHPARDMHDTFYFENGNLLRTHTSSVQIRTLENTSPPLYIIAPGRVYRCDSDQTHTPMFHQVEGLVVDKQSNFSNLIEILTSFLKIFFSNENLEVRFRPSFFPFTEPSAEADIRDGNNKWLEVLGCGMVHPNVLKNLNIYPEEYQGYAFGLGVERMAMLLHGIDDLRMLFDNDIRFLSQF